MLPLREILFRDWLAPRKTAIVGRAVAESCPIANWLKAETGAPEVVVSSYTGIKCEHTGDFVEPEDWPEWLVEFVTKFDIRASKRGATGQLCLSILDEG